MKKHGVILDMRNDRLTFWPKHCQHKVTTKPYAAEPYAVEPRAAEPHTKELHTEVPRKTILKQSTSTSPELLPHILLNTQGVSKIASTLEDV